MQLRPVAGFYRVRAAFLRGRRLAFVGAALVAVGMLAFAYAAHPGEDGPENVAIGSVPASASLSLSADAAARLADVLGKDCVGPIRVLVLDGTPASYDVVVLASPDCTANRLTVTPELGTVVSAESVELPSG